MSIPARSAAAIARLISTVGGNLGGFGITAHLFRVRERLLQIRRIESWLCRIRLNEVILSALVLNSPGNRKRGDTPA